MRYHGEAEKRCQMLLSVFIWRNVQIILRLWEIAFFKRDHVQLRENKYTYTAEVCDDHHIACIDLLGKNNNARLA